MRTYRESLTGILWMSPRNLSTIVLTGFKTKPKGFVYLYACPGSCTLNEYFTVYRSILLYVKFILGFTTLQGFSRILAQHRKLMPTTYSHFSSICLEFKWNWHIFSKCVKWEVTKGIVFLKVQGKVYRHKIDHKVDTVNLKTFYTHEALGFLSCAAKNIFCSCFTHM